MKRIAWYQGRLWHGMDLGGWLRLLARNHLAVHPLRIPVAATITLTSLINTSLRWLQTLRFGRRIARVEVPPDPVFIIGHWRTGTTMLHELLALDRRFRPPTTYESLIPNHFLLTEEWLRHRLGFVLPRTRPMDNMRMSFDRPQEDEAALCLRGVPSPFATVAFPNHPPQYARYGDLEQLAPAQLDRWCRAWRRYLQELLLKRPGRPLLKSPQHTFRLKVLTRMFPQAQYIYLVRDPYVVFPSTVHFWKTMYSLHGLQRPRAAIVDERVFDTLLAMHQKFQRTRHLVAPERLCLLRYEELVRDPLNQVRRIYESFGWPGFEDVRPGIEQYARRSKRYRTNRYEVPPDRQREITRRWAPYIEEHAYAPPGPNG